VESCSLGGGGGVQDEEKLVAVRLICQVGSGRAREEKVCGQTSLQADNVDLNTGASVEETDNGRTWVVEPVSLEEVHCCTLSLCYFGAETGYRVAIPYWRLNNINGATGAKFDQFEPVFFVCKKWLREKSSVFWPLIPFFGCQNWPICKGFDQLSAFRIKSQN